MLQGADLVHEVIAGGAVGLPVCRQCLVAAQNFFYDEVGGPLGLFAGRSRSREPSR